MDTALQAVQQVLVLQPVPAQVLVQPVPVQARVHQRLPVRQRQQLVKLWLTHIFNHYNQKEESYSTLLQ